MNDHMECRAISVLREHRITSSQRDRQGRMVRERGIYERTSVNTGNAHPRIAVSIPESSS